MKSHNTSLYKSLAAAFFFCAMIQANAQSDSKSFRMEVQPYHVAITSSENYLAVNDTIEDLASRMYMTYQRYPSLSYHIEHDILERPISVTINGIDDKYLAAEVSFYLVKLEMLGRAIHLMNYAHFPEALASGKDFKILNQEEAMNYVPEIAEHTILYGQMLTRNTTAQ